MSIAKYVFVNVSVLILTLPLAALAQTPKENFRAEMFRIAELPVNNETTDPLGDLIEPKHSVGFDGSYETRKEIFEEKRRITRTLEKIIAFNPNTDVLFPGSLIQGNSLTDGVLTPLVSPRKSQICTVSDLAGANGNSKFSKSVIPTLASTTQAVNEILTQQLAQEQPARMTYSESTFSAVNQGFLQLGAAYSWIGGSINGSFSQNNADTRTQMMVRFVQSYYTVSCAMPNNPDPLAIFPKNTNFRTLLGSISDGNPPAYVSSVTYGRELWMLIESNRSESEVKAMLDVAISLGISSGKVDFSDEQKSVIADSNIQVLAIGGGGKPAVSVITGDPSQLQNYLNSGANFSATAPGSPISYTVRYLKNNKVARVSSTQDYVVRTTVNSPIPAPLQAVTATWRTGSDGKDWDTAPVVDIYDQSGTHVAHIGCCSSDRNGDKWDSGRVETRNLDIVGSATTTTLAHGRLSAIRNPQGNDDWDYGLTVTFVFADGSSVSRTVSGRNNLGTNW